MAFPGWKMLPEGLLRSQAELLITQNGTVHSPFDSSATGATFADIHNLMLFTVFSCGFVSLCLIHAVKPFLASPAIGRFGYSSIGEALSE